MFQRIKIAVLTAMATAGLMVPVAVPVLAQTDSDSANALCQGVSLNPDETCADLVADGENTATDLANTIINIFSLIVGIVSVIMVIFGGFRYVTSSGDSGNVTNARNTIVYAIVGLVVVIFAQTIVKFVITKLAE